MYRMSRFVVLIFFCLFASSPFLTAQKSLVYDNDNVDYQRAIEYFEKEKFGAAQQHFRKAKGSYDASSLMRSYAEYYIALCAIELENQDAEYLMMNFIENNPENIKSDEARFHLGRHYYRNRSYRRAAGWFASARPGMLPPELRDEHYFRKGYSFFMNDVYDEASRAFYEIKDGRSEFSVPATYYYSHIAYTENNLETALSGFLDIQDDETFFSLVPYYITQIYYLQRRYEDVIRESPQLLEVATSGRVPEIARIIGESYYRLTRYEDAVKYLEIHMEKSTSVSRDDRYQLGYAYYNLGLYDKSAEQLERVGRPEDELHQNALYHLADCYIRLDEKSKARLAFESAARMDHNSNIQEDALFNYSVLTYELAFAPFNEAINGFNRFIELYPDSERIDEAYNYLVMAYMNTRNYGQALASLEKITRKTTDIQQAYQRVAFYRGLELFNDLRFAGALEMFDLSLQYSQFNPSIAAQSYYWSGEAQYRLENFDGAIRNYSRFLLSPGAFELEEYKTCHYNMGYAYFKQKDYSNAQSWFRRYLNLEGTSDTRMGADALNRIGDSYFSMGRYRDALQFYNRAVAAGRMHVDYALFQSAICNGLLGNIQDKISKLYELTEEHTNSSYMPDALYELGRSHLDQQSPDRALNYYNRILNEFPESDLARTALLQIGLVNYNYDRNTDALEHYKRVIDEYPGSAEARSALTGIRNIYIDMNDVESYFEYAEKLGDFADITVSEKDSLTYLAAENTYMSGDCEAAVERLGSYLDEFSNGIFVVNAHFYKADCHHMRGEYEKALESYNYVTGRHRTEFTEQALSAAAALYFHLRDYSSALDNYIRLEELAGDRKTVLEARKGRMRCHFELDNSMQAFEAANEVAATEGVAEETLREANFIAAKSLLTLGKNSEALERFRKTATEVSSREGAESKYRIAELYFNMGEIENAEEEINDFVSMSTPHQYWMANAFILLADIYIEKEDHFQARHTLQSVIDNYDITDDGIVERAEKRLEKIDENENIL